jgi:hypothetical protein
VEDQPAHHLIVFCGPTIGRGEVERIGGVTVHGPAKRGDVYLATLSRPWGIAIVDGYFDQTPAVWHKEILWARSLGIRVFGSSSIGALRAAELSSFGMEGHGEIYKAFASGELTADDEVAIVHGAEEEGFRPLSEALVNMRWTLRAAEAQGVLRHEPRVALEQVLQHVFYPERSFERALTHGRAAGLSAEECEALERWLPSGRIDQKWTDATQMLVEVARYRETNEPGPAAGFLFQYTEAWNNLRFALDERRSKASSEKPESTQASIGESVPSRAVRDGSMLRAIASREARLRRTRLLGGAVDRTVEEFRRERGLTSEASFAEWITRNFGSELELSEFFVEETFLRALRAGCEASARRHVRSEMIASQGLPDDRGSAGGPDMRGRPRRYGSSGRGDVRADGEDAAAIAEEKSTNRNGS